MPKVGATRAYRYYADRYYLDRANRDTYLARQAAGDILLSGSLELPALKTIDGVDLSVHTADFGLHAKIVRKTADETVNNSIDWQSDDELLFAVVANEVWEFEAFILHTSSTTADIQFRWDYPAGASIYWHYLVQNPIRYIETDSYTVQCNTTIRLFIIKGIIINGATAGNLTLQWTQAVKEAYDTKVLANSLLKATKVL